MPAFLTINHISKSYGFHLILNDVSFVVNAGERIGLVGANGVGKSTLLKIITGEIAPDSGEITARAGSQARLSGADHRGLRRPDARRR